MEFVLSKAIDNLSISPYYFRKYRELTREVTVIVVKFNLFRPLGQLEAIKGRRYEYNEIAERSGLSRQTVRNIMREAPQQINVATLAGLITFFVDEGMPVEVGQFFEVQYLE